MSRYPNIHRIRYGLLCLIWIGTIISDTGAENRSLSRDEAIRLAFRNNRPLKVVALEIARAKAKLCWSGRLDNPQLGLSASGDGIGLDEDEKVYEVAISQSFPLTSRLRDEKNLRRFQVILAEAEIAERRRQLASEVDLALIELLTLREKVELQAGLVRLNNDIVGFLREKAKLGEASILDVTQATIAGRTLNQQVAANRAQETQKTLALNQLLGLSPATELTLEIPFIIPAERPHENHDAAEILSRRPDHVLALARINEAESAVALENAKKWEDVSLRLFVEREHAVDAPTGLEKNTFAGVGISIPLPLRQRNQEGIEQAEINREAAVKGVEAAQFQIKSEYEQAYRERLNAWNLASDSSGELLELAEKNLSEFQKAQQQGQASLLQVQQAQEQLLQLKNASLDFIADYHRASARLRKAIGAYPGLESSSPQK